MDYRKFAAGLRNAAGSYALFYGAPRGDLEKAADVIEELAAKLEPSSTPLTLEELRGMDGEPVWVEIPEGRVAEWCIAKWDPLMGRTRLCGSGGKWFDGRNCGKSLFVYRHRPVRSAGTEAQIRTFYFEQTEGEANE